MCLALPGTIVKIEEGEAVVDYGGVTRRASLRLVPEAKVNDTALVHAGFVIQLLDPTQAAELIEALGEAQP